jgi:hypothetical protein
MMVFVAQARHPTKTPIREHPNRRVPLDGRFRQPTDVTVDPEGNIFISDGYISSPLARKNGDW